MAQHTLNLIDAIPGQGKTTAMIRYINESAPERRYIFCTPYLKQVERVVENCGSHHFITPDDNIMSKTQDLKGLIRANLNIATTHALFLRFDDEIRDLIRERNYTLIVDEAMDALAMYDISGFDARVISTEYCEVLDDGQLVWTEPDYDGKFEEYKLDVESGIVYRYSDTFLVRMCRIESFEAFQEVFLMTYLFDGQLHKAYFDLNGWDYKNWYVAGDSYLEYRLTEEPVLYQYPDYKSLISIKHSFVRSKLDTSGAALSVGWYKSHPSDSSEFIQLKKHLDSFFKTYGQDKVSANMWTTFNAYRSSLSTSRYSTGFVACNAKATNEYRNRSVVAYPINRYVNPNIVSFVAQRGGKVKHKDFALTEMIQWVWRSAIRDLKPITLYIPSDRMLGIFAKWLDSLEVAQ